jgi:hypothetical protein
MLMICLIGCISGVISLMGLCLRVAKPQPIVVPSGNEIEIEIEFDDELEVTGVFARRSEDAITTPARRLAIVQWPAQHANQRAQRQINKHVLRTTDIRRT